MAKEKRLEVVIHSYERLNNSVNGNPRYRFHTSEGAFTLHSDSGYGYEVTNHAVPRTAVLVLTPANRVIRIEG